MTSELLQEIITLILQIGPLGVQLFLKLASQMNLGPDEKQNIADAIAASDNADQATIDSVAAWLKANGQ